MNILLLGAGNMGSALARRFSQVGHTVQIAARSLDKAQAVAAPLPGVTAVDASGSASGRRRRRHGRQSIALVDPPGMPSPGDPR
jgi:prephenate dehydrogenase